MLKTLAVCQMKQAKRTRPSGRDQARPSSQEQMERSWLFSRETAAVALYLFFAQKPPRTICLRNVSGRNNEPASADSTKHLNVNRNAKQKRQHKSRARAQGASHIGIPKHP